MDNSKNFWKWFTANASSYEEIGSVNNDERNRLLDNFEIQLHNYCNKLYFEIGGLSGEPNELIITAEGDANYFEAVENLITDAPEISDWIFTAFKPQVPGHLKTEWGNIKLNTEDIFFNPSGASDKSGVAIIVYLPKYNPEYEEDYYNGLFKMLETLLGEKSFALDVKSVAIKANENQFTDENAIPILKLSAYLNWYKAKNN